MCGGIKGGFGEANRRCYNSYTFLVSLDNVVCYGDSVKQWWSQTSGREGLKRTRLLYLLGCISWCVFVECCFAGLCMIVLSVSCSSLFVPDGTYCYKLVAGPFMYNRISSSLTSLCFMKFVLYQWFVPDGGCVLAWMHNAMGESRAASSGCLFKPQEF